MLSKFALNLTNHLSLKCFLKCSIMNYYVMN